MDALYFRVSSDQQATENRFEDLLQVAEKDGSGRDWSQIRQALANCIYEEQLPGTNGATRTVYRIRAEAAAARRVFDRQQVVTLRDQEKLSWPEIARKLGVGVGTVRRAYHALTSHQCPA